MVDVSSGEIEKVQTLKTKVRLGAVALFTPFPVLALLVPNKKVYEVSHLDKRIMEVKIFGPNFQLLAYAPADYGNLKSLSELEATFRSAVTWKG